MLTATAYCSERVKDTHSKLAVDFFSWPKSIYYFALLHVCMLGIKAAEHGDATEFDERCGINFEIKQWLYHRTDDIARFGSDSGVHSCGD